MAGGKPCTTVTMYKDLGDEVDVVQVNPSEVKLWEADKYSTTPPSDFEVEEDDDTDEDGDEL